MITKKEVGYSLFFLACFFTWTTLSLLIIPSSDNMSSLLISLDISKGNFFLDGWNLSTQPYIFSDIIWTSIFIKIFGYTPYIANILPSFFFLVTIFFSIKVASDAKITLANTLVFFPFFIIPAYYTAQVTIGLNIHGGIYLLSAVSLYYLSKEKKCNIYILSIFPILSILFGSSDSLYIYIFLIPLLLSSSLYFIKTRDTSYLVIAVLTLASICGIKILSHFQLYIFDYKIPGEINPTIANIDTILSNSLLFIKGLELYFGINHFVETPSILNIIRIAIATLFIALLTYVLLKKIFHSFLDTLLSLCIVIPAAAFIFSTAAVDPTSSRYFFYSFLSAVIFIVKNTPSNILYNRKTLIILLVLVPLNIQDLWVNIQHRHKEPAGLANFLLENGLTQGYAKFWSAAVNAAPEGEKLTIAPIDIQKFAIPFLFLSKSEWYTSNNSFNFILTDNDNDNAVLINQLGKPFKTLKYQDTNILVWKKIHFDLYEFHTTNYKITDIPTLVGKYHDNEIETQKKSGILSFGPYLNLCNGRFSLEILGRVLNGNPKVEIRSLSKNKIFYSADVANNNDQLNKIEFTLDDGCTSDVEVLITVTNTDNFILRGYSVQKIK